MAGRQPVGATSSTSPLEKRTDSLLSIMSAAHMPPTYPPAKRQSTPDLKRREESAKPEFAPPAKRARPMSPAPRDRERDRFADGPRRRFGSPAPWEKDRDKEPHPMKREREHDEKSTTLPAVLTWFVGQLPNAASFDGQSLSYCSAIARGNLTHCGVSLCRLVFAGPIFRTDDLMMLFRNAVIPSATRRPSPPPPPAPPRTRLHILFI